MTAKELFDSMLLENDECTSTEMMIEFAKLHVEKALQKAYKNARIEKSTGEKAIVFGSSRDGICESFSICKHSITNAYPISNIK